VCSKAYYCHGPFPSPPLQLCPFFIMCLTHCLTFFSLLPLILSPSFFLSITPSVPFLTASCSSIVNPVGISISISSKGASVKSISKEENMESLDQLHRHCQQLVQDLEQKDIYRGGGDAFEMGKDEILRVVCSGNGAIDQIETFEEVVILGGVGAVGVLVTDSVCQVDEDDLPLPLPPPPEPEAAAELANSSSAGGSSAEDNFSLLDGGKLHYVKQQHHEPAPPAPAIYFDRSNGAAGNGSNKDESGGYLNQSNLDQLAKLHDLYASVSSISAKSQGRTVYTVKKKRIFW
jgi:hypothetical protein